ncbi:MAG: hypothetical protein LC623_05355 [Halobacteriales archaeon]|nr:hypothetical protein [Halobacteriales archaeon]
MKQAFIEKNFKPGSLDLIKRCDRIIRAYQAQGFRLTLRQLYYQLVSANVIRNEEKSYMEFKNEFLQKASPPDLLLIDGRSVAAWCERHLAEMRVAEEAAGHA